MGKAAAMLVEASRFWHTTPRRGGLIVTSRHLTAQILEVCDKYGDSLCARFKVGGRWESVTWGELRQRILLLAAGFARLGVKPGDRVALLANTGLEWTICDCAILAAGAVTVPIYCSLPPERIGFILRDAGTRFAIIEDQRIRELLERSRQAASLDAPMTYVGVQPGAAPISTAELAQRSEPAEVERVLKGLDQIGPEQTATVVYTSGTTGALKGVLITHGMMGAEVEAARQVFPFAPGDVGLACLPLAHVFGRLMQFYQLAHGTQVAYAESLERLAENYLDIRPHYVCVVPRMLEKIHERALEYLSSLSPAKRRLADWALKVGMERGRLLRKHRPVPAWLRLRYRFADRVFFRHLRQRLGGRLGVFICGGGRLKEEVAKFLHAAGLQVLEGYGLTETFAAATVNRLDDYHFGTVGKPLPGVELKLASDGEVLLRGPTVFREYLNLPEESEAAFDAEGWLKTGDLGEYSRDGFLRIVGRKKEMIVTAGGKNIAPALVESVLAQSPLISHAMVYGDGRKFLSALITLNADAVRRALAEAGSSPVDGARLSQCPQVRRLLEAELEKRKELLARYETIKRFAILDEEFTVATGELTPTLKMRREFIVGKYAEELEALYRD